MKDQIICPKCRSTEIYSNAELSKSGERGYVPISSWTKLFFDVYVCLGCGFVEEYISKDDLQNPKVMDKLRANWRKV